MTPRPTLTAAAAAVPSTHPATLMLSNPAAFAPGRVVNVQWQAIDNPSRTDWIGLYRSGDPDAAQIDWLYIGCAQIPLDARPLGSCNFLLPATLAAGTYEFRLLADNGYRRLAASSPLPVQ